MTATIVVERAERVGAPPETLVPLIADLRRWVDWSPWEDLDPALRREYTGDPGTVGSTYTWSGNRKAGAGTMTVESVAADDIGIALDFTRPFRSSNRVHFLLEPDGETTRVTWRMESPKTFFSRFINLDKMVGGDFEKGLGRLRTVAEAG